MQAFHRTTILASVLALLMGPQWCCCTMRGLVGPRPAATAAASCPCCGGAAAETPCGDADRATDHEDDRGGHHCPCRAKQRSIAVASVQVEHRGLVPSGPVLAGIVVAWPLREPVANGLVRLAEWPAPMTGRSRLSMLGVLRC